MKRILPLVPLLPAAMLHAQSMTFAWDANSETNLAGYKLLSGPRPGVYDRTNFTRSNTFTVTNMPPGRSFWVVVAVAADGLESDPTGNEVAYPQLPRLAIVKTGNTVTVKGIEAGGRLQQTDSRWGPWGQAGPTTANGTVTMPIANTAGQFFTTTR